MQNDSSFLDQFKKYIKHQGISLEITLDNNEKMVIQQNRYLEGKELVQLHGEKEIYRIPLYRIQKAKIYIG